MKDKVKNALIVFLLLIIVLLLVLLRCSNSGKTDTEETDGTDAETTEKATSDGEITETTAPDETTTVQTETTVPDETTYSDETSAEKETTVEKETTTAEETTAPKETTKEDVTTQDPATVPIKDTSFTLKTKNATLKMKITNGKLYVTSMKTASNEFISTSSEVVLPDVGKLTYKAAYEFTGERGTEGYRFLYEGTGIKYELFVVSNDSYSGPFEFYGTLTNTGSSKLAVNTGSYFNMDVKFRSSPTATTFAKESGVAEGWRIYSGQYYNGTGIRKTKLVTAAGEEPSSSGRSAVFTPSDYSALFFWTNLFETRTQTITFYIRGQAGTTVKYGFEAAHAQINGVWSPAVYYDCNESYTISQTDKWEKVTFTFTPSNRPGTDSDGKVWNEDHATKGYPLYIYTTNAGGEKFWIDNVTIDGTTQTFDGSAPAEGWPYGSWVPENCIDKVKIDTKIGYSEGSGSTTTTYKKATAAYTTNQDWNAGGDISMMYIDTGTQGMYFAQEWSNGKLTAQGKQNNSVALSAIIGNGDFKTTLSPKQNMLFPPIYIGVYDGDIETGSNLYKRWFINVKAPENMTSDKNEPLTQQDMQIGYNVSQYGIQSIKWDYGWWSNTSSGSWKTNEGLLEVKNSAYLGVLGGRTLKQFTAEANKQNVKLALYILLKDTGISGKSGVPTSVGTYGHPEWFSNRIVTVGKSADLGNEECVEFFQKYISKFFKDNGVTTWRSDFEPICRSSDKANRHAANGTDVQYWCTVGFSELVDYLIDNVKGFRYESCSSGGSMKDIFTMTKASVINCDDSADYMSLHMSFYDSSYCIHPAQLQLPTNSLSYTKGSANYTGCADFMYGLRCQITGAVMLSNWNGTNSQVNETNQWKTTIKVDYNEKLKPLIKNGDLYHILDRPDGVNWDGIEYVDLSAKNIKGAIMLWKPTGASKTQTVVLRGLNENQNYTLTFTDRPAQNCTMSGKDLMSKGLTVMINENVGSEIIYISNAK